MYVQLIDFFNRMNCLTHHIIFSSTFSQEVSMFLNNNTFTTLNAKSELDGLYKVVADNAPAVDVNACDEVGGTVQELNVELGYLDVGTSSGIGHVCVTDLPEVSLDDVDTSAVMGERSSSMGLIVLTVMASWLLGRR